MAAGNSSGSRGDRMNMMTFAQRTELQQSELSLAPNATNSSSRTSDPFDLESPTESAATQVQSLQPGPRQQANYVPSAGLVSTHGSILTSGPFDAKKALAGMSLESLFEEEDGSAAFDNWNSPLPEGCELIHEEGLSRPLYNYKEPPCPTRAYFPGDLYALDHGRPKTLPYDSVGPEPQAESYATTKPQPKDKATKKIDPFANRTIYNDYPHVFRPKPKPAPRPKGHERSRSRQAVERAFQNIKGKVSSFASNRMKRNVRKSGIGMSMFINASNHDFDMSADALANVLAVEKATSRAPRDAGRAPNPQKPRTVKVVGHPDRGTMIEDFMNPKTFDDSSSEGSIDAPAQPPVRRTLKNRGDSKPLPPQPRARKTPLRNRGDSKPLPPLPPEAFGPIRRHSSRRPSFVPMTPTDEMPRFDEVFPRPEDLFAGMTEDELSRAPRDNFLEAAQAANDLYRQPYGDSDDNEDDDFDDDPRFEQLFGGIDNAAATENAAAKYRGIPEDTRPRATHELKRVHDNLEQREHRLSDAIIVDTFPHDAHTSWRATQRTDERTIHWGYDRFPKEVHGSAGGQDAAGCLMEKLERQMKGTQL